MFVFLSKFLPPFVYPLGLACLLLLAAGALETRALLAQRRAAAPSAGWGRRLQRLALLLALLLLWVGGNRWVTMSLAYRLEREFMPPATLPQVDAIVLLGGGTESSDPPRPMVGMNSSGDRILYAAELYRQGKAPVIVVSGGLLDWAQDASNPAEDMSELLQWMGVPGEALWLQKESRNTYEDALYCAEILRQNGATRILLVTSAWHMPRSVRLFRAQGLEVIPAPTDFQVSDADWQAMHSPSLYSIVLGLIPSASALSGTTRMLKEYLGLLVYGLSGWY